MKEEIFERKYKELFASDKEKAEAFDKLAKHYYYRNFGSISKADIDLLMFSEYMDRLLDKSEMDINSYSDYEMSKLLGITQARISTLKERKELVYPYKKFNWKISLCRLTDNARYENGKVILFIPDRNLFIEIKNEIEKRGGFIDVQLNNKLLKVSPEYYIQLLLQILDDENESNNEEKIKNRLIKEIRHKSVQNDSYIKAFEEKSLSENIKEIGLTLAGEIIVDMLSGSAVKSMGDITKAIFKIINIVNDKGTF